MIYGGEALISYSSRRIHGRKIKPLNNPSAGVETKRSVSAKGKSRLQEPRIDEEPRIDDETYHTFVAFTQDMRFALDPNHYSRLKLRRIQAWVNRFVENCQKRKVNRISRELRANEIMTSEKR